MTGGDHSLSRDRISPRTKVPVTSGPGWELASEPLFITSTGYANWFLCDGKEVAGENLSGQAIKSGVMWRRTVSTSNWRSCVGYF